VDDDPPSKLGVLTKQGDSGRRRWVDRYFVLDDRRFLYREGESADGPVRQALELTPACTVEIGVDDDGMSVLVLTVPHADLIWRLRGRGGLPELRAWQTMLQRAIRPRWADTAECNVCQSRFNLLRWRHHCRRCGFCVCVGCSTHGPLGSLGYDDPTTVCTLCREAARRQSGADAKVPPHAIRLRLGQPAVNSYGDSREPLLGREQSGSTSALAAAASAFGVILSPPQDRQAERPPQTHAERIRIKYGCGAKAAGADASAPARVVKKCTPTQELGAAEQEGGADNLCVICLEAEAVIAPLPCGHRCLCVADSQKLGLRSLCPVCRQLVQQFQRIY
jgi:hypothetical protein